MFDFDGTLCDSRAVFARAVAQIARAEGISGLARLSEEELFGMNPRQLYRRVGLSIHRLPGLVLQVRQNMLAEAEQLHLIDGIQPLLEELCARGDTVCGVLTSNSTEIVQRVLGRHGVELHFVRSNLALFAKSRSLRSIHRDSRRRTARPAFQFSCYVGDETRDVEAARKAGYQSVAVTWGFDQEHMLVSSRPDHLVDSVEQMEALLRASTAGLAQAAGS